MTDQIIFSLLAVLVLGVLATLVFALKLYSMSKEQQDASAKLSYIVREDAKKYFEEAASRIIDTNLNFRDSYVEIVQQGTASALNETASTIEGSITSAQNEANQIILRARDDARRINLEARKMATEEMSRSLETAADTLSWVMERFVNETFTVVQHKHLIDRLVEDYISEYRR